MDTILTASGPLAVSDHFTPTAVRDSSGPFVQ